MEMLALQIESGFLTNKEQFQPKKKTRKQKHMSQ